MKYFLDQEFHERMYKPLFCKEHHIIELISIGIVAEDGREYYAVCNEFDLKAAWNKFNWKETGKMDLPGIMRSQEKEYWLRDNVLKPMVHEWVMSFSGDGRNWVLDRIEGKSDYKQFKTMLWYIGKSKKEITQEITQFIKDEPVITRKLGNNTVQLSDETSLAIFRGYSSPEYYGYYCDYDWVLFCSIFGRMIDLPKGFPMYCIDLKQTMDSMLMNQENKYEGESRLESWLKTVKNHPAYPKQENEHSAISDAIWNKKLYEFLNTYKPYIENIPAKNNN